MLARLVCTESLSSGSPSKYLLSPGIRMASFAQEMQVYLGKESGKLQVLSSVYWFSSNFTSK